VQEQFARHLITIGVRDGSIPGVTTSVARVTECLVTLGYRTALPELANLQIGIDLKRKLSTWAATVSADDIAIIYFAGHGGSSEEGRHYLGLPKTDWLRPSATALASEDMFRVLAEGTPLLNLLVILDTCYSGQGALDAAGLSGVLQGEQMNRAFWVATASRPKQEAGDEDFSIAFHDCVLEKRGAAIPTYAISTLITDLNHRFNQKQTAAYVPLGLGTGEPPNFLPNPNFLSAALLDRPIEERHFFSTDLLQHWKPRAIGSEALFQSGRWYFTGRTAALTRFVDYLAAPDHNGKGLIITGDPGCGKSALLGYVIIASDREEARQPAFEAFLASMPQGTRPAQDSITFALALRGLTLSDAIAALAERFLAKPEDVLTKLAELEQDTVLVFDALDESAQPEEIADRLLRPLSGHPHLRIIVGTRRPQIKFLGERFSQLDLDLPAYRSNADIAQYVARILLAEGETRLTPYRGHTKESQAVAHAIAERANGNYLIARTIARSLMEREAMIDPAREQLPNNMPEAFSGYLKVLGERSKLGQWRVREVLMPLAYAKGQGLPFDIWELFSPGNVTEILELAAAFIAEYVEEGRTVYRLYHQALADALHDPKQDANRQRKMVNALYRALPENDWMRAHWFTRKYFSQYAAAGDVDLLEQSMLDVKFLAAADLPLLLTASKSIQSPEPRRRLNWLKLALDRLTDGDEADRLSNLELCALQSNAADLAAECKQVNVRRKWSPKWARWSRNITPHRILRGHTDNVNSVALSDGIIVSGSEDYTVRFWNAATSESIGTPGRHENQVMAVAADSGTAVSGGWDDTVRLWDLKTGKPKSQPLTGHTNRVLAVAISGGVVASGDAGGTVLLWDLETATRIGEPLKAHKGRIRALAFANKFLITGGEDGAICIWDKSGKLLRTALPRIAQPLTSFAVGDDLIAAVYDYRSLLKWGFSTGLPIGEPLHFETMVNAIAIQDSLVACGMDDFSVRIVNLQTGGPIADPFIGHALFVRSVALGNGTVVSGADDTTVRIWDIIGAEPFGAFESKEKATSASVAISGAAVVTAGWDRKLHIWDLKTGQRQLSPDIALSPHPYENLPIAASDGMVVCNGPLDTIAVLNLNTGAISTLPGPADLFAISEGILATVGKDGMLRRWNLGSLQPLGFSIPIGEYTTALAIADGVIWTSGPLLRRWNLQTGEPIGDQQDTSETSLCVNSQFAVSSHWSGRLTLRDAKTGKLLQTGLHIPSRRTPTLALYKTFAITASAEGIVCIWNLNTMLPFFEIQIGASVNALTATPTGICIASSAGLISLDLHI